MHILFMAIMEGSNPTTIKWHLKEYDSRGSNEYAKGMIPNGDIRTITNMSRDFKRAIVDIRCPYEADQAHVVKILEDEMEKASEEIDGLTSVPEVMSILSFDVDAVMVRIAVQCPVGQHWRIERDLRTRVKARFDREGIQMPHYQKVIIK